MVVEGHGGPYYWAAWSMLRRKGGNVWRCVDSSRVASEQPTMTHAVKWAIQSAPPLWVAAIETWATGSGAKTAAARDGMVRAGGVAQAVVELHRPGVPVLWVQAPTWRRDVLRLRSTAREAAERVAVERMLGEGWTLTQPPAWATVHVAEARGIALWGMRQNGP